MRPPRAWKSATRSDTDEPPTSTCLTMTLSFLAKGDPAPPQHEHLAPVPTDNNRRIITRRHRFPQPPDDLILRINLWNHRVFNPARPSGPPPVGTERPGSASGHSTIPPATKPAQQPGPCKARLWSNSSASPLPTNYSSPHRSKEREDRSPPSFLRPSGPRRRFSAPCRRRPARARPWPDDPRRCRRR